MKNTRDDNGSGGGGKVDISLNGKKQTLYITSEDLEESEYTNYPTKITLKIGNSQVVFKSEWNDGLHVSVADFDKADNDIDIYITASGTDIGCTTYIYKFNGKKIYKYDEFIHFFMDFLYDEKGNIYYCMHTDDAGAFNKYYNYRTKKSGDRMLR